MRQKQIGYYNHMPAEEIKAITDPVVWDEYFKFCFERNPWDKAVSRYFHATRNYEVRPPLLEFLRSEDPNKLSNWGIYSIDGEPAVNHVGRYENLEKELERISKLLDLPEQKISLPRAKGTFREDRRLQRHNRTRRKKHNRANLCQRDRTFWLQLLGQTRDPNGWSEPRRR